MGGRADAIVVGAGIVGAACAYYLSRRGLATLVIEQSFAGDGASAAGMGHIVVMDDSPAQLQLTAHSRALWDEAAEEGGDRWENDPNGTLWIAADGDDLELLEAKAGSYRAAGIEVEVVGESELGDLEPELRHGLAGALRVPGDRVVYPPTAARWLLQRGIDEGVTVRLGERVRAIGPRSVSTDKGVIEADLVVNAAGVAAGRLTEGLPIEPRKGHLVITERHPGFCRHQLVELGYLKSAHTLTAESVAFNLQPRITGQMLIGSSRELVGWDAGINRRIVSRMLRRAVDFLPRLDRLTAVRTWVGFRPATPDKLPLIGPWPLVEGLWLAAGHEGLGITTSLATADLLSALVSQSAPPIDPSPFRPERFLEPTGA